MKFKNILSAKFLLSFSLLTLSGSLLACSPNGGTEGKKSLTRAEEIKQEKGRNPAASEAVCTTDTFRQPDAPPAPKVDVLFVMDNSESMNRHWQLMANKIDRLIREYPSRSDLRFAVILGTVDKYQGKLFSAKNVPLVLDGTKLSSTQISSYLRKTFAAATEFVDYTGAGEALFFSLYYAVTNRAKENQKLGFFRPDAALQVMFMSDDAEIGTKYPSRQPWNLPPKCNYSHHEAVRKSHYLPRGISTDTTFRALQRLKGDLPLTTNAFVNITKEDILVDNSMNAACIYDSPGYGYFDIVKKSDGVLYSIHQDRGVGLARTAKKLSARLPLRNEFPLSKPADEVDPSTIEAKVDGRLKPHTYNALSNLVRLAEAGTFGSEISIRHCEPETKQEWSLVGFAGEAEQRSAQVRWQTPEYATSGRLFYGLSAEQMDLTLDSPRNTVHDLAVSGLEPNTQYYFQAESSDEFGEVKRSEVISLLTKPDWIISSLQGEVSRSSASLKWSTTFPTTGKIQWGLSPDSLVNSSEQTSSSEAHSVLLGGLNANTTYYFQATSRDAFGLEKRTEVISLRTVSDWNIVGFTGEIGRNSAVLKWETPEYKTRGKVIYGLDPIELNQVVGSAFTDHSHQVEIKGLNAGTTYYFRAVGEDDFGLVKQSPVISLTTVNDWEIGPVTASATETTITAIFSTLGYPTSGHFVWGISPDNLTEKVLAGVNANEHAATLSGLNPDTIYYLQPVAVDSLGIEKRGEVFAMRTLAELPPVPVWSISELNGLSTVDSATIQWQTKEYATSGRVIYGITPDDLNQSVGSEGVKRVHSVTAAGLNPDTLYYFQVIALDDKNQEQRSAVISVRTRAAPQPNWVIQGFDGTTTQTSATLIWQTPGSATKATIEIGLSESDLTFRLVEVSDFKLVHLATVENLSPGTAYYFRVTAEDEVGGKQLSQVILKRTK